LVVAKRARPRVRPGGGRAMPPLNRTLPPLSALVAFEAVARHLSITRAADELALTQAAVSRKIRALEDDLGVRLFERLHRALRLTAEGERLQAAASASLSHVAETAEQLRLRGGGQVEVSTTIAFASFWLMPRIPQFRSEHPEVELRISVSDPFVDPAREGVDAGIRYGPGDWPGLTSMHLFDEEVFPVCSPGYLAAHPELADVAALAGQTLLHLDVDYHAWTDWATWFRALDQEPPPRRRGLQFNTYTILIQAATAGQGVALGWRHMVDDFLDQGSLVRPIAATYRPRGAYYLVHPRDRPLDADARTFVDWLLAEARG
jgi:putative choline sulfate-utilization transcription factor